MDQQCKDSVVVVRGQRYYPHVYTRDQPQKFLRGATLDAFEKLTDNEKLQAEISAEYLKKQGIDANAKDAQRASRKKTSAAALIGTGRDLGKLLQDPSLRPAMNLEWVEFTDSTVRWKRAVGNFHIQEM